MIILNLITLALVSYAGGFVSRMCGRKSVIPWGLEQFIYALPYMALGVLMCGWLPGLWVYGCAVLGTRTGHGQYISLGYHPKGPDEQDEQLDWIVRFFMGPDVKEGFHSKYWRCVVGMIVTGLAVTLAPAIAALFTGHVLAALLLVSTGVLKGAGYMLGWELKERQITTIHPNVVGEFFRGAVGWGGALCSFSLL